MKEVFDSGGEFTFVPNGTSMLPLIRPGQDSVTLASATSAKKGDIIFYRRDNGQFVLHRVVKVCKKGYIMCGDNQCVLEKYINNNNILARVNEISRDGVSINFDSPKYKSYVRSLPFKRFKMRARYILSRIKNKIFKKKAVQK